MPEFAINHQNSSRQSSYRGLASVGSHVVLVSPLRSSLGLSGTHDHLAVVDIRHPDAVESTLAKIVGEGDLPVVTCAEPDAEAVRRLLTFAAVRYPGFQACLEPLPGSPLAVGVISSLVDDLDGGPDDTLAWQLSALDYFRAQVWSAVWLPSVASLTFPSPSIVNHVRSWFPGSGFLAGYGKSGSVISAAKPPLRGVHPLPDTALLHSQLARPTWVVDAVTSALGPRSVSEVATVREQVDSFGTDAAVEFAAVPISFHSDTRPAPEAIVECMGCGVHHARASCPVCKMTAPHPAFSQGVLS